MHSFIYKFLKRRKDILIMKKLSACIIYLSLYPVINE